MVGLTSPTPQAARVFAEPLRPADIKWRGRNGDLRSDLGPYIPLVHVQYPDGTCAVDRQEDGSVVVSYPSGRKAVCAMAHHKTRRIGAVIYADREFIVPSAVPPNPRLIDASGGDCLRQHRTRHLGAFDEWGIGSVQSMPTDSSGNTFGLFEVSRKHVTVRHIDGRKIEVPRDNAGLMATNGDELRLKVTSEMTIYYDKSAGTPVVEFSSGVVQHTVQVGEVWRHGSQSLASSKGTTPAKLFEAIKWGSQSTLDSSRNAMWDKASSLEKTLKISSGTATLKSPLSASAPTLGQVSLADTAKTMCTGRIEWEFEHKLKKKLATDVAPPLARPRIKKELKEGFSYPREPVGDPPLWPQRPLTPASLQTVTAREVGEIASKHEGQPMLIVVLCVAPWAVGSKYSSSAHARLICEEAYGELRQKPQLAEKLRMCVTDVAEAGGIHAERRWINPLVKQHSIKSVPWMLMFAHGKCVMSCNPAPEGALEASAGGLGFIGRLRQNPKTFAKPRALIIEPVPTDFGGQGLRAGRSNGEHEVRSANVFKQQINTQETLHRSGYTSDLATTLPEARRMLAEAEPAYGLLIISSDIDATPISELATRAQQRNAKTVSFVSHNAKDLGPLSSTLRDMISRGTSLAGVLPKPLTKSRFEKCLQPHHDEVKVDFPKCGMNKETVMDLIEKRLSSV